MTAKKTTEETFNRLCLEIDLTKENGLVRVESDTKDEFQKYILKQAKEKLHISDGIFFLKPIRGPSIPLIYFHRLESIDPDRIAELHKLVWNMGQAPFLFIILPESVLIYSSNEPPKILKSGKLDEKVGFIEELKLFVGADNEIKKIRKYRRSELVTGRYWQEHSENFKKERGVYQTLLKNLEFMREKLIKEGLSQEIVHILLSRAIFIKYLEGRKDRNNYTVFPNGFFEKYLTGAKCFTDLLSDKDATYNLFQYLSDKFNGNIFLLEKDEKREVTLRSLKLLYDLLKGEKSLDSGQMALWPLYSFDVIPIELISNIYQKFFHHETEEERENENTETNGTYYTPLHIVTFLMDEVLPWEGRNTDIKIIDPSCGSGIFLVESYRRLISRWIQANPDEKLSIGVLKKILKENIFGVDINGTAIRIAALSLYLTICDYLEPRYIWEKVKFEHLINENLFESDFFEKNNPFSNRKYDLIVGNPPWQSKLSPPAKVYIEESGKPFGDKQICQVFLWRVAELCEPTGEICMLVSSKALLFNRSGTNQEFRKQFLSTFNVKTIVNFSAIRHSIFSDAIGPGAAVIFSTVEPDNKPIFYCSPKPSYSPQDDWLLLIEPQDINHIPKEEAIENDVIWKVAMWGTPRDYELIKRLSGFHSFEKICEENSWIHGEGFIVGNKKDYVPELSGKPYVDVRNLERFVMGEELFSPLEETRFQSHAKTKREIFQGPHLLIKQSPKAGVGLIAAFLKKDAVFRHSILGIHGDETDANHLCKCCLIINTKLLLYYEMLTSRSWLIERDAFEKEELMDIPMPEDILDGDINYNFLKELSENPNADEIVNGIVAKSYDLNESEIILINDTLNFTLDAFRKKNKSIAFKEVDKNTLENYINIFCSVLNNSFSSPKKVFTGIVYLGKSPLQVISVRLVNSSKETAKVTFVENNEMEEVLNKLDKVLLEERSQSVYIRRHLRRYSGNTIFIVKPNKMRYWTKSSALWDADKTYADIMSSWKSIKK